MLVRRVSVQNVRSFLDRQELLMDGSISLLIGPNGGGKTNLLDTVVIMLRRHLLSSWYPVHAPTVEQPDRYEFRYNDVLNNMTFERHSRGGGVEQRVEVEVETTIRDVQNMEMMRTDAARLLKVAGKRYVNLTIKGASDWDLSDIVPGRRFVYRLESGNLHSEVGPPAQTFLQYLQMFEIDSRLREEFDLAPLSTPMLYLPVNRSLNGFQSSVQLANYNEPEQKRINDAVISRSNSSIVQLAVGRLAQKYRLLLEKDQGVAAKTFRKDPNLKELTKLLQELGYEWRLDSIAPLRNEYDVRLDKQGSSFLVSAASSGERELLTYLFAIFALNVRDALIIVDEPELHLHPQWQKILLELFIRLSTTTGNQFLLATHAPMFVSPQSIQYVSRVYSKAQMSHIVRLHAPTLPEAKHLFNIVNSQNNERIFFADKVVLVEGILDRIFFEALLDKHGRSASATLILEVVSVGGKGLFAAYEKILRACQVEYSIVADLDYIEQIGTPELKGLFALDSKEIKKDVIDNVGSVDGATLVARIDEAMNRGRWEDANETWEYIKSRRRKLRTDLNPGEQKQLDTFIEERAKERVYILSRGALEAYLPEGYKSKEVDRLIRLTSSDDFPASLPASTAPELTNIVRALLDEGETATSMAAPTAAGVSPEQELTSTITEHPNRSG